jgi:hypothetical protein
MVSDNLVLCILPYLVSSPLLFLENFKEISLFFLSTSAGSFSSCCVSIETSLLLDLPCVPLSFNFDKGSLKSCIEGYTFLVFNFSSSSKSLIEGMLVVIVPDRSDIPSDFLFLSIKSSNFNGNGLSNLGSGISECLVNSLSSSLKGISPCLVHVIDVSLHSSLFDSNSIIKFTKCNRLDALESSVGSGHSGGSLSLHTCPDSFHICKTSLDFLVLSLGLSESPSPVTISVWVISIFWAFSSPSVLWCFLKEIDWIVI